MVYIPPAETEAALARTEACGNVLERIDRNAKQLFDDVKRQKTTEIQKQPKRRLHTKTRKSNLASATASRARHRHMRQAYREELASLNTDAQVVASAFRNLASEYADVMKERDKMAEKVKELSDLLNMFLANRQHGAQDVVTVSHAELQAQALAQASAQAACPSIFHLASDNREGKVQTLPHEQRCGMRLGSEPHASKPLASDTLASQGLAVPSLETPSTTVRESMGPAPDYMCHSTNPTDGVHGNGQFRPPAVHKPDNGYGYAESHAFSSAHVMSSECNGGTDVLSAQVVVSPTVGMGPFLKPGEAHQPIFSVPFDMVSLDMSGIVQQQHTPAP